MASYTEQVESHNPALTASGLAVWGWILRIVVALSFLVLPYVITTSTTLVDNQTAATDLQAIQAAEPYAPSTSPLTCNPTPAPAIVISRLQDDRRAGPARRWPRCSSACNTTHNLVKALTAAGGLSNPQVQGLLAYNPLALAIQKGQPVSQAEIRQGGRALAEPGQPARGGAEAGAGPEGLARRVEAVVDRLHRRTGWSSRPRVLHAGPLEPAGRHGATSTSTSAWSPRSWPSCPGSRHRWPSAADNRGDPGPLDPAGDTAPHPRP